MSELLLIALTAAIVSNFWLDRAGHETPHTIDVAFGVGAAVCLVLAVGAAVGSVAARTVLASHGLAHFAPLVSLLACVGAALVVVRLPLRSHDVLRSEVWHVTAVAALLAIAVRHATDTRGTGLAATIASAGVVFFIALALLGGVTERLGRADVPERLRGPALKLVAAALLSLAFMGFSGIAGL